VRAFDVRLQGINGLGPIGACLIRAGLFLCRRISPKRLVLLRFSRCLASRKNHWTTGPHDFAVHLKRRSSTRRQSVHRIRLPTSVTIAKRPLWERDSAGDVRDLRSRQKRKYFLRDIWTTQISLNRLTNSVFSRTQFSRLKAGRAKPRSTKTN
jgi:hypothetical protein